MTKYRQGWVPYGSDDEDILVQHPLNTSHADILAYFTANASSVVYRNSAGTGSPVPTDVDATLGLKTETGGYIATQPGGVSRYTQCDMGYQISLDIEARFLTSNYPEHGSGNYNPANNTECPIALMIGSGGGNMNITRHSSIVNTRLWSATLASVSFGLHAMSHGDYIRLNIGYFPGTKGGRFIIALDGRIMGEAAGTDTAARSLLANSLNIGSGFNGGWPFPYYVKNVQLVARSPMFNVHPQFRKVLHIGDSFTTPDPATVPYGDKVPFTSFERYLNQRNLFIGNNYANGTPAAPEAGTWTVAIGGGTIDDTASGANLSDYIASACQVQQPSFVCLFGGVNDTRNSTAGPEQPLSDFTDGTWETAYKTRLDEIIDNSPSDVKIAITTVPHYVADVSLYASIDQYMAAYPVAPLATGGTFYARVEAANAVIRSLEGYRDKVFVGECATKWWNGEWPLQTFLTDAQHVAAGAVSGVGNDFHPGVRGQYYMGVAFGEAAMRAIRG
jgi:L-fucose mutarotase/ribose pyranase (RbsD/FucU family)